MSVDLTPFRGKGWTPSLSVKTFGKDGANVYFLQYQPSAFLFHDKAERESWIKSNAAAKDLGYKINYYAAGKYGNVYIYEKDGKALTVNEFKDLANDAKVEEINPVDISKNIDDKLKSKGFELNKYNYRFGKKIDENDYITAWYSKQKATYNIGGIHKFITPLGENSVGINWVYDNENDFWYKIEEYIKKINEQSKDESKFETDKAIMEGIETDSVDDVEGNKISLPQKGFLIDSVYLKEGSEKGKGSGQELYTKALEKYGTLYSHFPTSEDAFRVQNKLVDKGVAQIELVTLSDGTELRKITKSDKKSVINQYKDLKGGEKYPHLLTSSQYVDKNKRIPEKVDSEFFINTIEKSEFNDKNKYVNKKSYNILAKNIPINELDYLSKKIFSTKLEAENYLKENKIILQNIIDNFNNTQESNLKKDHKKEVQFQIEMGQYKDDIENGKITTSDAKEIIESAGLQLPKYISDLFEKDSKDMIIKSIPFKDVKEGDYVSVYTGLDKNPEKKVDEGLVTFKYANKYLVLDEDNERKYNYSNAYYIEQKPKRGIEEKLNLPTAETLEQLQSNIEQIIKPYVSTKMATIEVESYLIQIRRDDKKLVHSFTEKNNIGDFDTKTGFKGLKDYVENMIETRENKKTKYSTTYDLEFKTEPIQTEMIKAIKGRSRKLMLPNGEEHQAIYAIVDLNDIKASHNEVTFSNTEGYPTVNGRNINDRNYKDDVSAQNNVRKIAENLNPETLISLSSTPSGTPIINKDGFVVSGNNRVMSLKLAAKKYPTNYNKYVHQLHEDIDVFGINIDVIPTITHYPVLVRIDESLPDKLNTEVLAAYNQETKKGERPVDKAIKLASILNDNDRVRNTIISIIDGYDTFSDLYSSEGRSDRKKLVEIFVQSGLIPEQQLPVFFDNGEFTEGGKDYIETLLSAIILTPDALKVIGVDGVRKYRQTIISSLPVLITNKNLKDGASLASDISDAVIIQYKVVQAGGDFSDYTHSQSLFAEDKPKEKPLYMNALLRVGKNIFKQSIKRYNDAVKDNEGASLFGETLSVSEIFDKTIKANVDKEDVKLIEQLYPKGNIDKKSENIPTFEAIKKETNNMKQGKLKISEIPESVKVFMPLMQQKAIVGSEEHWDTIENIERIISAMPVTYETDGIKAAEKLVYLHYFGMGSDWYIVEKDREREQLQAYGYVILNGDTENAEWCYINIEELKATNRVELDFFFEPVNFGELFSGDNQEEENQSDNKIESIDIFSGWYGKGFDVKPDDCMKVALLLFQYGFKVSLDKNKESINISKNGHSVNVNDNGGELNLATNTEKPYYGEHISNIPYDTTKGIAEPYHLAYTIKEDFEDYFGSKEVEPETENWEKIRDWVLNGGEFNINDYSDDDLRLFYKKTAFGYGTLNNEILDDAIERSILLGDFNRIVLYKDTLDCQDYINIGEIIDKFRTILKYDKDIYFSCKQATGRIYTKDFIASQNVGNAIEPAKTEQATAPAKEFKYYKGVNGTYKNGYEYNRAVEEMLDTKESGFTSEEKVFMSGYSGYGGLDKLGTFSDNELKTILFEYYTPRKIVEKMWGLAYKHGFKGGSCVETSCGIGEFIRLAPDKSLVTGYEINPYSAKIAKVLYPETTIINAPFETLFIKNNASIKNKIQGLKKHSLVIGNPPYGKFGGKYAGMGEDKYTGAENYIEYFLTRGLDLLESGGLLIMIIGAEVANGGSTFLQKGISKTKKEIMSKSILVDAYRLPNGVFERTDVLSDIIVLRKK